MCQKTWCGVGPHFARVWVQSQLPAPKSPGLCMELSTHMRIVCPYMNLPIGIIRLQYIVYVLWGEEGYTMNYSLSPREIPRPKPEGFPEGPDYISLCFLTQVTIQTFTITNPALTFLGDQYWKSWFSVLLWQLGNTGKYCPVDWAILER